MHTLTLNKFGSDLYRDHREGRLQPEDERDFALLEERIHRATSEWLPGEDVEVEDDQGRCLFRILDHGEAHG